jgi:starch synthase
MRILMVAAEFAPLAKTGGLADAVAGLTGVLAARGHDVRVVMPRYAHLHADEDVQPAIEIDAGRLLARAGDPGTPRVYLLDRPELFADSPIYLGDDRDAARFLALCDAALALPAALHWQPDIFHCHDWHTALVPAMLRAAGRPGATLLSLHNVGYQGVFGAQVMAGTARDPLRALLAGDGPVAGDTVNFLRAGIRYADRLCTVSPTYAREIRSAEQGMGLEDLLDARAADLVGILNGVDYSLWSPAQDPHLARRYDAEDPAGKHDAKRALIERVGLERDETRALIGVVSRITWQKGIDLLAQALPRLLAETDAAFVVLGTGDADVADSLRATAAAAPGRFAFMEGHDEPLAHQIFAGADLLAIPSRYEPCGLTQLYALRYGTIPVVRRTGGLADTVHAFDPATGTGNGSVFDAPEPDALTAAVRHALEWYAEPQAWSQLIGNAMRADFSWAHQVGEYEALYTALAARG